MNDSCPGPAEASQRFAPPRAAVLDVPAGRSCAAMVALWMLATFALAHLHLGIAAARAGRSWLLYGVLPLLAPILGFLVSFGVLRSRIPYAEG